MARAIVEEVNPRAVILFGSRAKGLGSEESDVDLMVITSGSFDSARARGQELRRIRRAFSSFRVAKDILVYSEEEMKKWKHSINHILAEALREGKRLYERP